MSKNQELIAELAIAVIIVALYLYFLPDCAVDEKAVRGVFWWECVKG